MNTLSLKKPKIQKFLHLNEHTIATNFSKWFFSGYSATSMALAGLFVFTQPAQGSLLQGVVSTALLGGVFFTVGIVPIMATGLTIQKLLENSTIVQKAAGLFSQKYYNLYKKLEVLKIGRENFEAEKKPDLKKEILLGTKAQLFILQKQIISYRAYEYEKITKKMVEDMGFAKSKLSMTSSDFATGIIPGITGLENLVVTNSYSANDITHSYKNFDLSPELKEAVCKEMVKLDLSLLSLAQDLSANERTLNNSDFLHYKEASTLTTFPSLKLTQYALEMGWALTEKETAYFVEQLGKYENKEFLKSVLTTVIDNIQYGKQLDTVSLKTFIQSTRSLSVVEAFKFAKQLGDKVKSIPSSLEEYKDKLNFSEIRAHNPEAVLSQINQQSETTTHNPDKLFEAHVLASLKPEQITEFFATMPQAKDQNDYTALSTDLLKLGTSLEALDKNKELLSPTDFFELKTTIKNTVPSLLAIISNVSAMPENIQAPALQGILATVGNLSATVKSYEERLGSKFLKDIEVMKEHTNIKRLSAYGR